MNFPLPGGVLAAWFGPAEMAVSPLAGGTNNASYEVEGAGGRFYLRMYRHVFDQGRILYEHALLTRLAAMELPLAVPVPMPARSGGTLVVTTDGTCAALFPFLSGAHANGQNPAELRACGEALAALDMA